MGSWTIGYAKKPSKADIEMMVTRELTVSGNNYYRTPLRMTTHILKNDSWDFVTHAVCDVRTTTSNGDRLEYTIVYTVMSGKVCGESDEIVGKIMDETYEPSYAELCPVTYLKGLTEPLNEYSVRWRAEVKAEAEILKSKKIPLKDRKYKVGEEICTYEGLVQKIGTPLHMLDRSKKMKGQTIGKCLVCGSVAFTRVE